MTNTKKNIRFPEFLDETKPTSWWVIVAFALFHIGYTLLVWHVLIHWKAIKTLSHLTGNLLQPTLWYNLISLVIIIGGVILWLGKLEWKDIGLLPSRAPAALVVTVGVWIAVQLVFIIASLVTHRPVEFNRSWTEPGTGIMLGSLIAQLLGNSLYEELAFRGFLLPQLYLKLQTRGRRKRAATLFWAVIISQLFFALIHLPMLVSTGENILLPLLWTALGGIFLAVLYLRTENLLLVVGLHALMNKPTLLIHPSFPPQIVIAAFMILLLLCGQVLPFLTSQNSPHRN